MNRTALLVSLAGFLAAAGPAARAAVQVPLDAEHWNLLDAEITTRDGRPCLAGVATVKDVEFEDGVIELDMWLARARTYAGVDFRIQSPEACEQIYIRPHRAPFYPDALQYTPVFNGVAGWQLYNGSGFTGPLDLPYETWIPVRLEVAGGQARVFVNDLETPALRIHQLEHGPCRGAIGVDGRKDGGAYFSNFRYSASEDLAFSAAPYQDSRPGTVAEWEISQRFDLGAIDFERYPGDQEIGTIEWRRVTARPDGLLDIARHVPRGGAAVAFVLARATLTAPREETREFAFGYSDAVTAFLNGRLVFKGSSAYQERDPSFLGVAGLFDSIYLPLRAGDNELLFVVAEAYGGWGLMGREGAATHLDTGLEPLWETPADLRMPESVAYDPAREVLYVSNYGYGTPPGTHSISKIGMDGEILAREWVTGLRFPLGLEVVGDRLFVAQRGELLEIDLSNAEIVARHSPPEAVFLNDVAHDPSSGDLFVSDSRRSTIYRLHEGVAEPWISAPAIRDPNGLLVRDGTLYVCNNGDRTVKAFRIADRTDAPFASFREGTLDGLADDGRGGLLLSHWEGRLYDIAADGGVTKLIDTSNRPVNCADFRWIPEKRMLIVPTFGDNRVVAYRWD